MLSYADVENSTAYPFRNIFASVVCQITDTGARTVAKRKQGRQYLSLMSVHITADMLVIELTGVISARN